ncbi:hypothetical protein HMPREF2782_07560 [Anaerococcus sp. HMSC068A02]|uniref:hypothetical protein n=1 Tax=Anaerococcus sp. HMSC068A02 TaxID=1739286 RepID=UPI0008A4660E|nr:hypothetical protein [Anaerococcus sp. HMSC068A02]OFL16349.1 hypothetical protein HMPREF2782_07560 [Anaerococcus sp. HMSC068A02]
MSNEEKNKNYPIFSALEKLIVLLPIILGGATFLYKYNYSVKCEEIYKIPKTYFFEFKTNFETILLFLFIIIGFGLLIPFLGGNFSENKKEFQSEFEYFLFSAFIFILAFYIIFIFSINFFKSRYLVIMICLMLCILIVLIGNYLWIYKYKKDGIKVKSIIPVIIVVFILFIINIINIASIEPVNPKNLTKYEVLYPINKDVMDTYNLNDNKYLVKLSEKNGKFLVVKREYLKDLFKKNSSETNSDDVKSEKQTSNEECKCKKEINDNKIKNPNDEYKNKYMLVDPEKFIIEFKEKKDIIS